jgi:hypothetical protein
MVVLQRKALPHKCPYQEEAAVGKKMSEKEDCFWDRVIFQMSQSSNYSGQRGASSFGGGQVRRYSRHVFKEVSSSGRKRHGMGWDMAFRENTSCIC